MRRQRLQQPPRAARVQQAGHLRVVGAEAAGPVWGGRWPAAPRGWSASGCRPVEAERDAASGQSTCRRAAERGQWPVLVQGRVAAWTRGQCVAPSFPQPLRLLVAPGGERRGRAGRGVGLAEPRRAWDRHQRGRDPAEPWFPAETGVTMGPWPGGRRGEVM